MFTTTFYRDRLQSMLGRQTANTGRIAVVGIGGAGGNAIDTMMQEGIDGVDTIAINTDSQVLATNQAGTCLQVGRENTGGLGAGADPEVGARAVETNREQIRRLLEPYDMVIVTAGMGGGTGTGAAPIVASIAQEMGVLTIGIVTRPFSCEGGPRMETAEEGIERLRTENDTLIVIPNDRLLDLTNERTSLKEAFRIADKVLCDATRGIVEIITHQGLVNLDFADVERTMKDGGKGMLGVSTQFSARQSQTTNMNGSGRSSNGAQQDTEQTNRSEKAAIEAISSPLFNGYSIQGAENVLVNVKGGEALGFQDVMSAVEVIQAEAGNDSEVLFGAVVDEEMNDHFQVTVIATGVNRAEPSRPAVSSPPEVETQPNQVPSTELEGRSTSDREPKKRTGNVE